MKYITFLLAMTASSSVAESVSVSFSDGAPKDRFELSNLSCDLENVILSIDLTQTPAGLIFDVTGTGAGVEVFQPVEVTAGTLSVAPVTDGAQMLVMSIPSFPRGAKYTLTADLDDTVSGRQITVSGSEMLGATVSLTMAEVQAIAPFADNGEAIVDLANAGIPCPMS